MTFISYAQNLEDVVLWKALKNVKNGFYIDVGANDPLIDSVTNAFYNNGWHGINIEPINAHFKKLVLERPRDINLNYAISESKGNLDIWECEVRGWATLDRHIADTHEKNGYIGKWHNVKVKTLAEVCAEYQPENIHFLKIDVEGLEISVLKGNDWSKYRPWIVIVEATFPNTQIERYSDLEELLVAENYVFAYADGLNRFYVSAEHIELLPSLKYPPNIFDDYQTYSEYLALQEVKIFEGKNISLLQENVKVTEECHLLSQENLSLSTENERVSIANNELSKKYEVILEHVKKLEYENAITKKYVKKLEYENAITKKYVGEILNSTSWRITAPVRLIGQLKHGKKNDSALKLSRLSKKLIKKVINKINKHPKLRYQIVNIIKKIGLYSIARSAYLGIFINNAPKTTFPKNEMFSYESNTVLQFATIHSLSVDELHNRIKNELKATTEERGEQ